ncbi:MAG: prepilin-type N-terminal cleavage/methylation domain-containing protein [Candidatus Omnitrophota bacterium]|nr:prepilin-type N-terminal cleavage/methylation domain-containing protein [Candidatus Omnitrophota bacterium]
MKIFMFRLKNEKGISLIEVLVSAVILVIVVVSLLGVFVIGRIGSAKVKHRAKAMNLLRAKMEEIKAQDYSDFSVGTTDEYDVENTITAGVDELLNDVITTQVASQGSGLKVTVTIAWDEKKWLGADQQQGEELITLIYP